MKHCRNGHAMTPENTEYVNDRGRKQAKCSECRRIRDRARQHARVSPVCKCGAVKTVGPSGRRYCRPCSAARMRRLYHNGEETPARIDPSWLDEIVVERVVRGGLTPPGRPLTPAEWFAVLDAIGEESNGEIARRGGSSSTTVRRMRRLRADAA